MQIFKTEDFLGKKNPTPGEFNKAEILTEEHDAEDLGALFVILPGGQKTPYVFHRKREQIIFFLTGEVIAIVDGKEVPLRAGDVLFTPPGEKHRLENRTDKDVRFFEFFTIPPWASSRSTL